MTEKKTLFAFRIPIFVAALIVPILFMEIDQSYSDGTFVYVSNGEDGDIAVMKLDPKTGDMKMVEKAPAGPNVKHMALSPDHRFLYASIRSEPFSVITYLINSETGNLTQLSKESLPHNMAYISVDQTGRFLLSVSYADAKIAVNPIDPKGFVQSEPVQVISTGPNPHSILVDQSNRFVYVPHLGNDQIKQFLFNESTGVLTPNDPAVVYTKDGSGPRHFDFSPNNRFVYVSNEMDGMVYSYKIDNRTGNLTEIQRISAIPLNISFKPSTPSAGNGAPEMEDGEVTTIGVADIHITPDGRWVYVSERATSTIAAFAVEPHAGNLTHIGSYDTEKTPRGINIDPSSNFVIAAGQESGHVSVHAINQETGELEPLNRYESGKDSNWIEIVEFN
ncbi:lactonase family protein [Candidatus Nitrosocosmicus arcticus]|uniref:6-phosphogluconolactonase n=1 Tax=Candidatus Nitrosocosmicus arcticus TaxID=2035267 RepID=A0A557SY95_9ARCH|nr:beta-propeller fold lactonase family protein [Candidatus Nitrosocosmicus arcticus]TVP41563.1 6-phosphogluconolactonase [Candidatus Nitrosocosmicus arcticus]